MKAEDYTKDVLLDVLDSYRKQIENTAETYPTVLIDDLYSSIHFVLKTNGRDFEKKYLNFQKFLNK